MFDPHLVKKKESEIKQRREKPMNDFMNKFNITRKQKCPERTCGLHYYVTILGVEFNIGLIIETKNGCFAAFDNTSGPGDLQFFGNEFDALKHLHKRFAETIEEKING